MTRHATPLEVIERQRPAHELRAELADLWRDGFRAGADAAAAELANRDHIIGQLEYEIANPEWRRRVARETLAAMDAVRHREESEQRRRILDHLEATDLFEYRRLAHLRLTDESAYLAALEQHQETAS